MRTLLSCACGIHLLIVPIGRCAERLELAADIYERLGVPCLIDTEADELRFEVSYSNNKGDDYSDHSAVLGWDASKNKLRVISREAGKR